MINDKVTKDQVCIKEEGTNIVLEPSCLQENLSSLDTENLTNKHHTVVQEHERESFLSKVNSNRQTRITKLPISSAALNEADDVDMDVKKDVDVKDDPVNVNEQIAMRKYCFELQGSE